MFGAFVAVRVGRRLERSCGEVKVFGSKAKKMSSRTGNEDV